jgi:PAS domain S-box-containing protein
MTQEQLMSATSDTTTSIATAETATADFDWHTFFDLSSDLLCIIDLSGNLVRVNHTAAVIFGRTRTELIGQPWDTLVPTAHKVEITAVVDSLQQPESHAELNIPCLTANDEERPFHWHCRRQNEHIYAQARPLPGGDSQLNQDQLVQILNAMKDVIIVKRPGSQLVWGNNAFRNFFGINKERYDMLLSGQEQPPTDAQFVQEDEYVFTNGETLEVQEDEMQAADGMIHTFNTIKSPIKDEDGHTIMLVGVSRDVTDRRDSEAILIKRAAELEILRRISTMAATNIDIRQALQEAVNLIKISFDLYHAHVFLVNDTETGLVLRVGAEEAGPHMVAERYQIGINDAESLIARAARGRQAIIENDLQSAPSYLANPYLPDSRSSLAIPMIIGDTLIGVFNVQSDNTNHFSEEDIRIHTTLAEQIALAWQNAQYFERSERAINELNVLMRRMTREGWEDYLANKKEKAQEFTYEPDITVDESVADPTAVDNTLLQHALTIQGESIGVLELDTPTELDEDAAEIIAEVSERLSMHLENLRLSEQTQEALAQTELQASRLGLLNEMGAELGTARTFEEILEVAGQYTFKMFDNSGTSLAMLQPDGETLDLFVLNADGQSFLSDEDLTIDNSALGISMRTQLTQRLSHDPESEYVDIRSLSQQGLQSFMTTPLIARGRVIGTVNIGSLKRYGFNINDENLFQQIGALLAATIESRQLLAEAQRQAQRERLVNDITQKIQGAVTVEAALQVAIQELGQALQARHTEVELKAS